MKGIQRLKKNRRRPRPAIDRLQELSHQPRAAQWRHAVRRLANDIANESSSAPAESISHADCEEMLPWYVTDEQRGENVRKLYPAAWWHLQACHRCVESYALLVESFPEEANAPTGPSSLMPSRLSFLHPTPHAMWHQQRTPRLLGGNPSISFLLNPAHLQKFFSEVQSTPIRGEGPATKQSLLLADQMIVNDQLLDVQVWLAPSPHLPHYFHLHLLLRSPTPLKTNLQARLRWGDQEYTSYLVSGEASLEDISPPDFSRAYDDIPSPEFNLTFEVVGDA